MSRSQSFSPNKDFLEALESNNSRFDFGFFLNNSQNPQEAEYQKSFLEYFDQLSSDDVRQRVKNAKKNANSKRLTNEPKLISRYLSAKYSELDPKGDQTNFEKFIKEFEEIVAKEDFQGLVNGGLIAKRAFDRSRLSPKEKAQLEQAEQKSATAIQARWRGVAARTRTDDTNIVPLTEENLKGLNKLYKANQQLDEVLSSSNESILSQPGQKKRRLAAGSIKSDLDNVSETESVLSVPGAAPIKKMQRTGAGSEGSDFEDDLISVDSEQDLLERGSQHSLEDLEDDDAQSSVASAYEDDDMSQASSQDGEDGDMSQASTQEGEEDEYYYDAEDEAEAEDDLYKPLVEPNAKKAAPNLKKETNTASRSQANPAQKSLSDLEKRVAALEARLLVVEGELNGAVKTEVARLHAFIGQLQGQVDQVVGKQKVTEENLKKFQEAIKSLQKSVTDNTNATALQEGINKELREGLAKLEESLKQSNKANSATTGVAATGAAAPTVSTDGVLGAISNLTNALNASLANRGVAGLESEKAEILKQLNEIRKTQLEEVDKHKASDEEMKKQFDQVRADMLAQEERINKARAEEWARHEKERQDASKDGWPRQVTKDELRRDGFLWDGKKTMANATQIPQIVGQRFTSKEKTELNHTGIEQYESGLPVFVYHGRGGLNKFMQHVENATKDNRIEGDVRMASIARIANADSRGDMFCLATASARGTTKNFVSENEFERDVMGQCSKIYNEFLDNSESQKQMLEYQIRLRGMKEIAGVLKSVREEIQEAINSGSLFSPSEMDNVQLLDENIAEYNQFIAGNEFDKDDSRDVRIKKAKELNGSKDLMPFASPILFPEDTDKITAIHNKILNPTKNLEAETSNEEKATARQYISKEEKAAARQSASTKFSRQLSNKIQDSIQDNKYQHDLDCDEMVGIVQGATEKNWWSMDKEKVNKLLKQPLPHSPYPGISILRPKNTNNVATVTFNGDKGDDIAYLYIPETPECYVRARRCDADGLVMVYTNGVAKPVEHKKGDVVFDTGTIFHLNKLTGNYDAIDATKPYSPLHSSALQKEFGSGRHEAIRSFYNNFQVKAVSTIDGERNFSILSNGQTFSSKMTDKRIDTHVNIDHDTKTSDPQVIKFYKNDKEKIEGENQYVAVGSIVDKAHGNKKISVMLNVRPTVDGDKKDGWLPAQLRGEHKKGDEFLVEKTPYILVDDPKDPTKSTYEKLTKEKWNELGYGMFSGDGTYADFMSNYIEDKKIIVDVVDSKSKAVTPVMAALPSSSPQATGVKKFYGGRDALLPAPEDNKSKGTRSAG